MLAAASFLWATSLLLVWWYRHESYLFYPRLVMWIDLLSQVWMFSFGVLIGVYSKRKK